MGPANLPARGLVTAWTPATRDYHATEFIGRLAADPETRYAETNGTARTRFRVLVNEEWKDRDNQVQKHVESYVVVVFNGLAEACSSSLFGAAAESS